MANFKRRKCRRNCFRSLRGSETSRRAMLGIKPHRVPDYDYVDGTPTIDIRAVWPRWYNFMSHNPAWFDREFHTRPHRVATRRFERAILAGADPDDIAWPVRNKPTNYYW